MRLLDRLPARHRLQAALLVLALTLLLTGLLPHKAIAAETTPPTAAGSTATTLLTRGHTDVFALVPNGDSISLVAKEDLSTPGTPHFHNPATIIFGVGDEAKTDATASIEGIGAAGYALPQSENPSLLWPGWDSTRIAGLSPTQIRLVIDTVEGPGTVYLWRSGAFNAVNPVFEQGGYDAAPGRSILQHSPTHEHANWLFSAPGDYTLTLHAEAQTPKGRLVSEAAVYTFAVGGEALARAEARAATLLPSRAPGEKQSASEPAKDAPASEKTRTNGASEPTAATGAEQCIPTPLTSSGGGTAVGGSHTIRANTHVHPNWVFTQAGTYKVSITQSARMKSGQIARTSAILTFEVGGSGNADSGHFDIGTSASASGISMLVKDDRTQPARWMNPSALVFGLGSAAEVSAPAGIEFIAKQGQKVWMISSSQVASVPWVGANTMHPELLRNTSGDVTWTLNGVSGPGALAVFESGNFGSLVGTRWFGGIGGPGGQTTYVGRTADGRPCTLDEATIARLRAEGHNVDASALPSGLASTGSSALTLLVVAPVLAVVGFALARRLRAL